jgi:hypothetical protein
MTSDLLVGDVFLSRYLNNAGQPSLSGAIQYIYRKGKRDRSHYHVGEWVDGIVVL